MKNNPEIALAGTVGNQACVRHFRQSRLSLSQQNVCRASLTESSFGGRCVILEQEWAVYLAAAKGERSNRGSPL